MAAKWAQKTVVIPAQRRGCYLITPRLSLSPSRPQNRWALIDTPLRFAWVLQVLKEIESDLAEFKCGLAHFFRT
jgi:hypothetical protein